MTLKELFSSGIIEQEQHVLLYDKHMNRVMTEQWQEVVDLAQCLDLWQCELLSIASYYNDGNNSLQISINFALYTVPKSYLKAYEELTGIKL